MRGVFYVLRHLKNHTIFLAAGDEEVYAVLGLGSPLADLVPFVPCYVQAVLIPWEDRIIYDSLLVPYNIAFGGGGIRRSLADAYRDTKERGAVITSLLPPPRPEGVAERQAAARATGAKVLDAYRKYLFASGFGPKVVERDMAGAADFAMNFLATRPDPLSLREFGPAEVGQYLSAVRAGSAVTKTQRASALTGMKRLVEFLRDTGRMDYDLAEDLRKSLRGRGDSDP